MSKFFQALENADRERAAELRDREVQGREHVAGGDDGARAGRDRTAGAHPSRDSDRPIHGRDRAHDGRDPAGAGRDGMTESHPRAPENHEPASHDRPGEAPPTAAPAAPAAAEAHGTIVSDPSMGTVYGSPVLRRRDEGHARTFLDPLDTVVTEEGGALDDHLVSLLAPTGFAAEQYRTVRLAIERHRREQGLHVVAISSPGRTEGKTVTAINVAGALAQAPDARVALVDADLRHPRVADYLGLPPGRGLSSYLVEPALEPEHVIQRPSGVAFAVVVAGGPSAMPYELLKSPRFTALFQFLRAQFDYVVVDTPPVLMFPDVGLLRDAVDGFILVVRANYTPREGVIDGLDTVGRHRLVGVVFNDDTRHPAVAPQVDASGRWRRYVGTRLAGGRVA